MDRRAFLRSSSVVLGAAGAAGVLSACGDDGDATAGGEAAIPDGPPELNAIVASFELLTGTQTIPFGLRDLENVEVADADVQVYLRSPEGEVLGGPFPTRYTTPPGTQLGLYLVDITFDEPGTPELVAVEGDRYGAASVNVTTPEASEIPAPGQAAIVVETPTEDEDLGYDTICTQEPQCGMHDVSLATALEEGRPVMLLFATPAYCQTAVCGPAVETVDNIRAEGEWGDVAWIHTEIYSSYTPEEQTLGEPVQEWELPSEPWLFSIDANGDIADRADGPMFTERIEGFANDLMA